MNDENKKVNIALCVIAMSINTIAMVNLAPHLLLNE